MQYLKLVVVDNIAHSFMLKVKVPCDITTITTTIYRLVGGDQSRVLNEFQDAAVT